MKYLKQFSIILLISFVGEFLHHRLPFPVPASIYGVAVLFFCLEFKVIQLSAVKDTGDFLIEIMPVMFIPPAVGLVEVWGTLYPRFFAYFATAFLSTFFVMFVSGKTAEYVANNISKRGDKND